ncbi:polyprenyl synthetase family protein [Streptomyces sp. MUM 178J]|uniref:polyprenyl synthetase family protein n=1 Tax=Streptomyces sp. MUM 178J TaxID=2791991 RepID=UPI001F03922D|nr:polyprenyl synthetase family protein [Streptomyces sp. MUM 178J]WRQ80684.1 polyprenyl synthetase family protein [Streptomyces sp. MUM 178J]
MRFTQATFRHRAAPAGGPSGAPTARRGEGDLPGDPGIGDPGAVDPRAGDPGAGDPRASDLRAVDDDVPAAIQTVLARVLAARLDRARGLDRLFTRDLAERVADFTLRGGRRIRPRLLWWSLRACGGGDPAQVRAALRAGAALELLQTCALVHDDVMDAAPMRRGRPALHTAVARQYGHSAPGGAPDRAPGTARRLGEAAAVLAGDLALAWADDMMTDLLLDGGALPPGAVDRLRAMWRTTRTEMVAGQYLDVRGHATARLTVSHALRAASLKSALYTVKRPLEAGAALAGAGTAATRALCRAGRCAGLAFQLRDDLDDLFADPAVTGKPSGGDVSAGRPTYVMAVARARAAEGDSAALGVLDASLGRADLTEDALDRVRDVVIATGARDLVRQRIERLSRLSLRHLAAAGLEPGPAAVLRVLLAEITGAPGHVSEPADGPSTSDPATGPGAGPATGPVAGPVIGAAVDLAGPSSCSATGSAGPAADSAGPAIGPADPVADSATDSATGPVAGPVIGAAVDLAGPSSCSATGSAGPAADSAGPAIGPADRAADPQTAAALAATGPEGSR